MNKHTKDRTIATKDSQETAGTAQFSEKMGIQEALRMHPGVKDVLEQYGMLCGDCMASPLDSLVEGAKIHEVDINEVLQELNCLIKSA